VLRHVTEAFREDPVRILRLARFAARFPDFTVAPETMTLMRAMVSEGEVNALVSERVWQELSRGLMGAKPSRMLQVLRECGALQRLLPEVNRLYGVPQRAEYHPEIDAGIHLEMVLDQSARMNAPLEVRFACLCHDLGKGTTPAEVLPRHIGHEQRSEKLTRDLCTRWRVPVECKELAELVAREHGNIHQSGDFGAEAVLRLLLRCDAMRRPERFLLALQACECDARGRSGKEDATYSQGPRLALLLELAQSVDSGSISAQALEEGLQGPAIGARIDAARLAAISAAISAL
jgi:tRNA nucleotidyltransferase (CCA-adding enzyme)